MSRAAASVHPVGGGWDGAEGADDKATVTAAGIAIGS